MNIDKKTHMVSIPLEQYNELMSKIESDDFLANKFQDFIKELGECAVRTHDQKVGFEIIREILKNQGMELTMNFSEGKTNLAVKMIKTND